MDGGKQAEVITLGTDDSDEYFEDDAPLLYTFGDHVIHLGTDDAVF